MNIILVPPPKQITCLPTLTSISINFTKYIFYTIYTGRPKRKGQLPRRTYYSRLTKRFICSILGDCQDRGI